MVVQAALFDATGQSQGQIDLPENIFGAPGSRYTLHEVVVALQGNQRRGTSSTKTRGLVSGGGRKPWKQKGTGNARAGSNRSPLWRGGGIIFGPSPRSYRIDLDESKKNLALMTALGLKTKAQDIVVADSLDFKKAKTSEAVKFFEKVGHSLRTLLVVENHDVQQDRLLRNISWLEVIQANQLNAWLLLRARKVIILKSALDVLIARFPKG